jgi:hypothetical protein
MRLPPRVLIKYLQEEDQGSSQIHSKSVKQNGDKTLSLPDVSYWARQLRIGREIVENSRRSGRPTDFQTHFRIEGALEAPLSASARDIAQNTDIVR